MDTVLASRSYTEIEPRYEWIRGEEYDTLLVDVSGFKKDQLKVHVDGSRNLKISGECYIQGNRWRRFLKDFPVPENCNVRTIQANLDGGILFVILPKPANQVHSSEQGNMPSSDEQLEDKMREDSSFEGATSNDQNSLENLEQRMGTVVKKLRTKRQLAVNIVVAIVVIGLGTYARYWLKMSEETSIN